MEILTTVAGYRDIGDDGFLYESPSGWYYSREGDEKNPALPSPTGSLDAAMTLVPDAHNVGITDATPTGWRAYANVWRTNPRQDFECYHETSVILALCIAALKALRTRETP